MRQRLSGLAFLAAILFARSLGAGEPDWPKSIAIATASPGGTYYVYGQALADILSKELALEVAAQPTHGPTPHLILIDTGHAALGLVTIGIGCEARKGRARGAAWHT